MTTPARSDHDAVAPTSALRLVDTDPAELSVDAVVIGVYSQDATAPNPLLLAAGSESVAVAFDGKLTDTLGLLGASGSAGEVTKVATLGTVTAPLVVAVGLGPEPAGAMPTTEALRRGAAVAVRALAG
ncbi:MAG TPA: M17 family peptidase N-terminal domain-containing protein, partial [Micromonosporaceae bacterium]